MKNDRTRKMQASGSFFFGRLPNVPIIEFGAGYTRFVNGESREVAYFVRFSFPLLNGAVEPFEHGGTRQVDCVRGG